MSTDMGNTSLPLSRRERERKEEKVMWLREAKGWPRWSLRLWVWSEQLVNSTLESAADPELDWKTCLRLWIVGGGEWWEQAQDKDLDSRWEHEKAFGWQAMLAGGRRRGRRR